MTRIIGISDTHNQHSKLTIPECDLLISAGDWSYQGKFTEVEDFAKWLNIQPAHNIVICPGNHELYFEKMYPESLNWILDHCPRAKVLIHNAIEIDGIKIFGSGWSPYFCDWAYNGARNQSEKDLYHKPLMKDLWAQIPDDTELLITHSPPYGILDYAPQCGNVGCKDLFIRTQELKNLKAHLYGHIHYSYSIKEFNGVKYYNLSNCTESYNCINPPTVIDL